MLFGSVVGCWLWLVGKMVDEDEATKSTAATTTKQNIMVNVAHANITPPRQFEYGEGSRSTAAARWKIWTREVEFFLAASSVTDDRLKVYTMLNQAGPELQAIYQTKWPEEVVYKTVIEKFKEYFEPQRNVMLARANFANMAQGERGHGGETIDDFATRLRQAAVACEFGTTLERDLKIQLYRGTSCVKLKRELADSKEDEKVDVVIEKAKKRIAVESTTTNVCMESVKQEPIGAVGSAPRTSHRDGGRGGYGGHVGQGGRSGQGWQNGTSRATAKYDGSDDGKRCFKCNRAYPHVGKCPAIGQRCRECNGHDHFASARECPKNKKGSSNVNHVESFADRRMEKWCLGSEVFSVIAALVSRAPRAEVRLGTSSVTMMIDSGAAETIIDEATYEKMVKRPKLVQPETVLHPFGRDSPAIEQCGQFEMVLHANGRSSIEIVRVVRGSPGCLLSYMASRRLAFFQTEMFDPIDDGVTKVGTRPKDETERVRRSPDILNDVVYVNAMVDACVPKTMTRVEIASATANDVELKLVTKYHSGRQLSMAEWQKLDHIKSIIDEFVVVADGVVLRGSKIVLPVSLQRRAIEIAHRAHLGVDKTIEVMSRKVWFAGMDEMVERVLVGCRECPCGTRLDGKGKNESSRELSDKGVDKLAMDFYELFRKFGESNGMQQSNVLVEAFKVALDKMTGETKTNDLESKIETNKSFGSAIGSRDGGTSIKMSRSSKKSRVNTSNDLVIGDVVLERHKRANKWLKVKMRVVDINGDSVTAVDETGRVSRRDRYCFKRYLKPVQEVDEWEWSASDGETKSSGGDDVRSNELVESGGSRTDERKVVDSGGDPLTESSSESREVGQETSSTPTETNVEVERRKSTRSTAGKFSTPRFQAGGVT